MSIFILKKMDIFNYNGENIFEAKADIVEDLIKLKINL